MANYNEFYKGWNRSKFDQSGFEYLNNCNIWEEIGSTRCNWDIKEATGSSIVDESCIVVKPNSSAEMFFVSTESGKIWKRSNAGVYSLDNTDTNGAHLGAAFFGSILYYWTATTLGKEDGGYTDTLHTFSQNCTYRPCTQFANTLFIGNFNDLASVSSTGSISDSSLDILPGHRISAITSTDTEIIIGTTQLTDVIDNCKILTWDSYSASWLIENNVNESGIKEFIKADNRIFIVAGDNGNVYYWNGRDAQKIFTIKDEAPIRNGYASTSIDGRAYYGTGTKVFSIDRYDVSMGFALNHEYTTTGTIKSLNSKNGVLYIGSSEGVEQIDTSNAATATIITPEAKGQFDKVIVEYQLLPGASSIDIYTKVDRGNWIQQTTITDTINKRVYFDGGLGVTNYLQAKIVLNPSGANTPLITNIRLE